MIEENDTPENNTQDKVPKKGNFKLIMILLGLGILGTSGAFLWFKVVGPAIGVGGGTFKINEGNKRPEKIQVTTGPMYPIEPFIINLAGEGGKRFLKLTMELEMGDNDFSEEITANLPKIKDSIIMLLSNKTFEEIYTFEGKLKLRDEITRRINSFLVSGQLRNIYFTEFVIQ